MLWEVVQDITRIYLASWSEDYNGPKVQTHFGVPEVPGIPVYIGWVALYFLPPDRLMIRL